MIYDHEKRLVEAFEKIAEALTKIAEKSGEKSGLPTRPGEKSG